MLLCLGCHSLIPLVPPSEAGESAVQSWQKGQEAMRQGQPEQALEFYQRSLAADPRLSRAHLSLAAAYLDKGEDAKACPHLTHYVRENPQELTLRVYLADLLLRLARLSEARAEFDRCVAQAQERDDLAAAHLLHCHTRLMEIAEAQEDLYGEHLNRGIGLYILARQRAALKEPTEELCSQALLCKSAGELTLAHIDRPEEARPSWYLHAVWSQLAQSKPARRSLLEALAAAPFSYLTAPEQRELQLASHWRRGQPVVK